VTTIRRSALGTCFNAFRRGRHVGNVYEALGAWYHDRAGCNPLGYPTAQDAADAIQEPQP
jgi:hypothetical protein